MPIFDRLIACFGSLAQMAEEIGVPYPTVAAWKRRGSIPTRYWQPIINGAAGRNISISPADFLSSSEAAA